MPPDIGHQPGRHYEIHTLPDGSKEAVVIPLSEEGEKNREKLLKLQLIQGAGPISNILDRLKIDDVVNLVNDELTDSQTTSLKNLLTQYRDEKSALDESDQVNLVKLRLKYGKELNSLLLPEQVNSTRVKGHIFRLLTAEGPVLQYLDVSGRQRSDISFKCEQLNKEIVELAAEIEKKTEKLKERVTKVLTDSLTEEQREKLERLMKRNLDKYFDDHNLEALSMQTLSAKQPDDAGK